jgi:hypothetical protein
MLKPFGNLLWRYDIDYNLANKIKNTHRNNTTKTILDNIRKLMFETDQNIRLVKDAFEALKEQRYLFFYEINNRFEPNNYNSLQQSQIKEYLDSRTGLTVRSQFDNYLTSHIVITRLD